MIEISNGDPAAKPFRQALWSSPDRTRQFLIPDALELPPGELLLRTATGREWRVDPAAIGPYEVSEEEAVAWAKASLEAVMRQLGAGLREAIGGSAVPRSLEGATEMEAPAPGPGPVSPTPGLDLLADLTGTPRGGLAGDYGAIGRALRTHLGELGSAALDAVGGDPARMAAARERMDRWTETLRAHGIGGPSEAQPGAVPEESPPTSAWAAGARTDRVAEPPEAAGREPGDRPDGITARLRDLAEAFSRRADALAGARGSGHLQPAGSEGARGDAGKPSSTLGSEPIPAADPARASAMLESVAHGIEGLAGEVAARLRERAAQLRQTAGASPEDIPGATLGEGSDPP
jgi:hypothetical protein